MKTPGRRLIVGSILTLCLCSGVTAAGQVEVLWLGHATTRITSIEGKVIVIDPFLKKNPTTPAKYKDLKALGKVDLILVTHGHSDHTRDLGELARMNNAVVVGNQGLMNNLVALGIVDASKTIPMDTGGTVAPLGRGIKVHMVPAQHSSSTDLPALGLDMRPKGPQQYHGGTAVGYVVELENGFKIYHSGDTAVFGDMALIHEFYHPDLAMVCIGGHYTMDPKGAAYAMRELVKPKQAIPIHYGTYPVINRTPAEFKAALGDAPIEMLDLRPGQTVKY